MAGTAGLTSVDATIKGMWPCLERGLIARVPTTIVALIASPSHYWAQRASRWAADVGSQAQSLGATSRAVANSALRDALAAKIEKPEKDAGRNSLGNGPKTGSRVEAMAISTPGTFLHRPGRRRMRDSTKMQDRQRLSAKHSFCLRGARGGRRIIILCSIRQGRLARPEHAVCSARTAPTQSHKEEKYDPLLRIPKRR